MKDSPTTIYEIREGSRVVAAGSLDDVCAMVARGLRGGSTAGVRDRHSERFRIDPDRRALVYVPKEST